MSNPQGRGGINRFFRMGAEKEKTGGNRPADFSKGATMQGHRSNLWKIIVKIGVKVKNRVINR
jgi:hypothetical protein